MTTGGNGIRVADKKAKSSSEAWQSAVSTWEKSFNGLANATMANDEFSGMMGQAMKLTLLMQQSLGNVMAVYLSALNLPTKTEVAALGERLDGLESRLARMTELLERLTPAPAAADPAGAPAHASAAPPMPPRTKRPPERAPEAHVTIDEASARAAGAKSGKKVKDSKK